jgi:hypothetical protein
MKWLLLLLLPVACAPAYDPSYRVITPDGKLGYAIDCSSASECYQWAGYRCQQGYTILNDESHSSFHFQENRMFGASGSSHHHQSILIECKDKVLETPIRVHFCETPEGKVIECDTPLE